jgi:hypothetical protein
MGLRNSKILSALTASLVLTGTAFVGNALTVSPAMAEPATAPWSGQTGEQFRQIRSERLEAFTKMDQAQRHDFFQAQRSLEERFYRQRLSGLNQNERCLDQARGQSAVETCLQTSQQTRRELRRQEMTERQALNQRYGLPTPQRRAITQSGRGDKPQSEI